MYSHAKFSPPLNPGEKRLVSEHCAVYTNQKRYAIQDLENECVRFATKENPMVYFCISECTKSTPAVFIFSVANFEMTELFATRHFLNKTLIVDASNYEVNNFTWTFMNSNQY